ncbi:GIY-YIG nuclease family protein [Winogradskyella psychrotolerans]|uniref:GIY-YIG nuclease family protein n=1 Tax=Winogradskyella psychrotolerans TaxID=1344585 RepID=UPI0025B0E5A4|nr:GIY-YIG nuclease family protein [Winogradskyella psychrotolerans]
MSLWYIYIMSNKFNGTIYIGVTNNLEERVKEHKLKIYPDSFTSKYNCNKLVYFEEYSKAEEAIVREKRLKKWKRDWKIKLIEDMNPSWVDISDNWNIDFNRLRDER